MSEPLYEIGDMVEIAETQSSLQFGGEFVIITKAEKVGDIWCYDFVIPERRGGVPEHLIKRLVADGFQKLASR